MFFLEPQMPAESFRKRIARELIDFVRHRSHEFGAQALKWLDCFVEYQEECPFGVVKAA